MKSLTVGQKQICLLHADHMPVVIQGEGDRPDASIKAPLVTRKRRRTQMCERLQMRRMTAMPTDTHAIRHQRFSRSHSGTSKSIEECQYQLKDRHWNCSVVRDGTVFGPVLNQGSRRWMTQEFIQRAPFGYDSSQSWNCICSCNTLCRYNVCRQSGLQTRSTEVLHVQSNCSTEESSSWLVMGRVSPSAACPSSSTRLLAIRRCGDNIDYGYRFGRDFVDTPEREIMPVTMENFLLATNRTGDVGRKRKFLRRSELRRQTNLHNNEVGRRVRLTDTMLTSVPFHPSSRPCIDSHEWCASVMAWVALAGSDRARQRTENTMVCFV